MKEIHVYLQASTNAAQKRERWYGYIVTDAAGNDLQKAVGKTVATQHGATLTGLYFAVKSLGECCTVYVHSEDAWVLHILDPENAELDRWAERGFCTKAGDPVKNAKMWHWAWRTRWHSHRFISCIGKHARAQELMDEFARREKGDVLQ